MSFGTFTPASPKRNSDATIIGEEDLESQHLIPKAPSDAERTNAQSPRQSLRERVAGWFGAGNSKEDSPKNGSHRARLISDAVIGLSDGLTVPFALTAGLSASGDSRIVIYGALAELIAGAISMGCGGYLGARSEYHSWAEAQRQTKEEILGDPEKTRSDIMAVFKPYDISGDVLENLSRQIAASPKLDQFMMEFHQGLPEPPASRAFQSATTIAAGYLFGGIIPLIPYFCYAQVLDALYTSCGIMAVALFTFGYCKTCFESGWNRGLMKNFLGGLQLVLVGGFAAGVAYGLVLAFNRALPGNNPS